MAPGRVKHARAKGKPDLRDPHAWRGSLPAPKDAHGVPAFLMLTCRLAQV